MPEELGAAFTIQQYDSADESRFFSHDSDVIGLSISVCALDWSRRAELSHIQAHKQWSVQVVSSGKPRFFTKNYKMVLSSQTVSKDDSSCSVREYLPQYLSESR